LYETPHDAMGTLLRVESLPQFVGAGRDALVDAVDFSETMVAEAKAKVPLGARPRSSV